MRQVVSIYGVSVVTLDQNNNVMNVQFLTDDELSPVLERGCQSSGQLQMLRNGSFDFVSCKPKQRANSTLLKKAAHGRISATRDGAFQLTLKVFKREGLDVRETMISEALDLLNNVKF